MKLKKEPEVQQETVTVWVTKYWKTRGIVMQIVPPSDIAGKWLRVRKWKSFHGNEWHLTEEAAVAYVRKRAAKQVAELRKTAEKIEQTWLQD